MSQNLYTNVAYRHSMLYLPTHHSFYIIVCIIGDIDAFVGEVSTTDRRSSGTECQELLARQEICVSLW